MAERDDGAGVDRAVRHGGAAGGEGWGRGARFGLGPTSGERIIWYATWNATAGGKDDGDSAARLRELFGAWHDPIPAIVNATPETALIRNDIYDRWPARTWSHRGRAALIGDAIHPMTPDLAQGACQAIVDATILATCLAASRDARARYGSISGDGERHHRHADGPADGQHGPMGRAHHLHRAIP